MSKTENNNSNNDSDIKDKKNPASGDLQTAIPENLPILPARGVIIFPIMIYPILVGRPSTFKAVYSAIDRGKYIFVSSQKDIATENPTVRDISRNGTICRILTVIRQENNTIKVLLEGISQGRIVKSLKNPDFLAAKVEPVVMDFDEKDLNLRLLVSKAGELFKSYVRSEKSLPNDLEVAFENSRTPQNRLWFAIANTNIPIEKKQKILDAKTLLKQYEYLVDILTDITNLQKLESEVDKKAQTSLQKMQKKVFIQEQIKALESELDEEDRLSPKLAKMRKTIDAAGMPKPVLEKANEEFAKLQKTPQMSPEYTVMENWLQWLIDVPWKARTADTMELKKVQQILDEDHYGMEKPKERILEYIAVLNLTGNLKRQILCFVGPPGVGKTSLAKSIARALNRKCVRISLGGVRDEAEIRGHRRTYIGALPGKIIQSMKKAGTVNPVFILDEIDKMSSDFQGDPSAALLEVLDPEQNIAFNDHYLDVDYDLSNVLFITTANVKYDIPAPLLDRMQIIDLESYLDFQKFEIARRHIIPNTLKQYGLADLGIEFTEDAIYKVIREYTMEAGVRNLEREISSVLRKFAKDRILEYYAAPGEKPVKEQDNLKHPLSENPDFIGFMKNRDNKISVDDIEKYLKTPYFRKKDEDLSPKIGVVTGLAWTSVGGDILPVEVRIMPGAGKLTLTGKLGDVMKESAMAALSLVRSRARQFDIKREQIEKKDIHIHFPEGAIPKDGPSAGITMTIALISAISGRAVRGDLAMTGEITLSGKVLPIGGLNEKLLAAKRAGIKTILIPKENTRDLEEINSAITDGLEIIPVAEIGDVVEKAFI